MKPSQFSLLIATFALAATAGVAVAATPTAITECGQRISGDGFLVADLDCTGDDVSSFPAVTMAKNGTLDFAGFTITGGTNAVECEASCRLSGGTISYGYLAGVVGERNVEIVNMAIESRSVAVSALKRITVEGSTIAFTGVGLWSENGVVKVTGTTISNGSDSGIRGGRVKLEGTTITGMPRSGVRAVRAKLRNSSVTGSATDAACDVSINCADLYTVSEPRLRSSLCDTSTVGGSNQQIPGNPSWDVCALD